jgi:predicted transcriptional regulator
MHQTLEGLGHTGDGSDGGVQPVPSETGSGEPRREEHVPAVTVRKSLASPDKIISLIDGKPYSTLKRHLAGHGLTPDQYRERYGLKADYPMTAPAYSEKRKALAKKIGLGAKGRQRKAAAPAATAPKAGRKTARK